MSQFFKYPPFSVSATNPSVGNNGSAAPSSSTEVGGVNPGGNLTPISVDNAGNQNVNVVASVLPTNAAQETGGNLASINTKIPTVGQKSMANSFPVVIASDQSAFPVTSNQGTANTLANAWPVKVTDGTNAILINSNGSLIVAGSSAVGAAPANNPISVSGVDGGGLKRSLLTDTSGRLEIDTVQSLPLPAGASTSALQTSGNASLTSIDSKIPALGQALAAGSVPVVLTSAQLTTLTPLSTVTVTQPTGTNLHVVVDSQPAPISPADKNVSGTLGALNSAVAVATNGAGTVIVELTGTWVGTVTFEGSNDGFATSQAIVAVFLGGIANSAATATVNGFYSVLPQGFAQVQARMSAYTSGSATVNLNSSVATRVIVPIQGNAANLQMTATQGPAGAAAWKVDGSAVTQPISAAALPLPNGAATSALQTTISGQLPTTLGAKTTANSLAVNIASDQTVPVSGTVTVVNAANGATGSAVPAQATQVAGSDGTNLRAFKVSATGVVSVDGSAVTQPISNASLVTIAANTPSNGQATMANSSPVVIASNQSAIPVTSAGIPAALGQTTMSASQPVVIASDQSPVSILQTDINITGQAAQTAVINNIIPVTASANANDASGYKSASIQIVSTGTAGTFIFEGSNDNVNFQAIPVFNQLVLTGTPITAAITATVSQLVYTFPITARYLRVRIVTTITGGSIQAFTRLSQMAWSVPITQIAQATAANLQTTATIASGTVTTVSTVTAANLAIGTSVADVASAALTTTTTTAAFTPTNGISYQIQIPVTVVSGTLPTLDVQVQESADAGTNWYTVYTFPRITAVGSYMSPPIQLTGNRVRYVQTVAGTTPSFTRAVNRMQLSLPSQVRMGGKSQANAPVQNLYGTTNVTSAAYVQLVASLSNNATEIEIFDSSGVTLKLAVGAAGSEIDQIYIIPGGNGRVPLFIPAGSRIAVKAASTTASSGELDINFYN